MDNKEDILAKWMSGEISDADLEASEGTEALQELKRITREVDEWSLPKYNTDAGYKKMKERLQDKSSANNTSNNKSIWLKRLAILGTIAVLLFGLFSYFGNQEEELKAVPGQMMNYAFQDGSEVWLNDGSSIKYQTSEWNTQRSIDLEGEALFKVSKGSPFTVNTPNGVVTVLGTQFNVRGWGDNLFVECYEGKVQVKSGEQLTVLTANEGVSIIEGSMKENQVINNSSPSWKNGTSRFNNEKLRIVCDELERQYQISVDLNAIDRLFSGSFKHNNLDLALRSICKPLDLKYSISQDRKSVVIE